jgi:hypothetical protein
MPKIITQEFLIILKICQTKSTTQSESKPKKSNGKDKKEKEKRQAINDDELLNQEEWVKERRDHTIEIDCRVTPPLLLSCSACNQSQSCFSSHDS